MVKISHDHILSWVITLPPVVEQKRIVETVHSILQSLDSLTAEATHAIDLLQERRTALISAAVTGKIDVRGMAKEQTA
jgi:type I restriction enzyme S subunit